MSRFPFRTAICDAFWWVSHSISSCFGLIADLLQRDLLLPRQLCNFGTSPMQRVFFFFFPFFTERGTNASPQWAFESIQCQETLAIRWIKMRQRNVSCWSGQPAWRTSFWGGSGPSVEDNWIPQMFCQSPLWRTVSVLVCWNAAVETRDAKRLIKKTNKNNKKNQQSRGCCWLAASHPGGGGGTEDAAEKRWLSWTTPPTSSANPKHTEEQLQRQTDETKREPSFLFLLPSGSFLPVIGASVQNLAWIDSWKMGTGRFHFQS